MGPIQSLDELRRWLFRRAGLIALVTTVLTMAGVLQALNIDRVYHASAVIQIQNLARHSDDPTLNTTAVRRIQAIEQRIMARDNLLALGERFGIFDGLPISPGEQLQIMRQSVSIEAVAALDGGGELSALIVSVSASTPQVAAAMANELADNLVRENVLARRAGGEAALAFYQAEEARVDAQIREVEDEITAFQAINEDVMPGALSLRRDELARLSDNRLELQREISEARGELAGLDDSGRVLTQRRAAQLNESISRRSAEVVALNDRIAEIQALFQRGAELELQVNAMNRRMTQLQVQLTAVAERRREVEIAARMEDDNRTERLQLLEAALPPEHPVSRRRIVVIAAAGIAGVLAGLILAFLVEWHRPVLRTAAMFERELQLRPVITLPYQLSRHEQRRRRLIWFGGLGTLILAGAGFAVAAGLI